MWEVSRGDGVVGNGGRQSREHIPVEITGKRMFLAGRSWWEIAQDKDWKMYVGFRNMEGDHLWPKQAQVCLSGGNHWWDARCNHLRVSPTCGSKGCLQDVLWIKVAVRGKNKGVSSPRIMYDSKRFLLLLYCCCFLNGRDCNTSMIVASVQEVARIWGYYHSVEKAQRQLGRDRDAKGRTKSSKANHTHTHTYTRARVHVWTHTRLLRNKEQVRGRHSPIIYHNRHQMC